jgi:hypothetical protein
LNNKKALALQVLFYYSIARDAVEFYSNFSKP